MWRWLKHWRDWAMNELWTPRRIASQASALYFRSEKAGLTLDNQPIPWNAEAVLVEALLRLPSSARKKNDFTLRLPDQPSIQAEALRRDETSDRYRLFFRLNPPRHTTTAELYWKSHPLGKLELPVLNPEEFIRDLRLLLPTVFVQIAGKNIAAQTFVASQCKGITACGVVRSSMGLAPLLDLGLKVCFRNERTGKVDEVAVPLIASQMGGKEAMLSVVSPSLPRKMGEWTITWMIGDRVLAAHRLRGISLRMFLNSLRICDTRFVIIRQKEEMQVIRQLPSLSELKKAGPCFFLCSREAGMAGVLDINITAQVPDAIRPPSLLQQSVIVTDGPTPIAPGLLDGSDLLPVTAFELRTKKRLLGTLPLSPVPTAAFNAEGAFKPPPDFTWTNIADEELNDRLSKLMDIERGSLNGDNRG